MHYMLVPLHKHYDMGFGATGNAFRDAAVRLESDGAPKQNDIFFVGLPINFLRRHAIELFLKSAIVIFHRRLKLPYGGVPYNSTEPMVQVGGKWKPFNEVHGIKILWSYVNQLFTSHAGWLAANTKCDWTHPPEIDHQVDILQAGDPRSTFFRYPTTSDLSADVAKSAMKEMTQDELTAKLKASETGKKVFTLVMQDENDEFVTSYVHEGDGNETLTLAIKNLCETLYDTHAALRWELCGGS